MREFVLRCCRFSLCAVTSAGRCQDASDLSWTVVLLTEPERVHLCER